MYIELDQTAVKWSQMDWNGLEWTGMDWNTVCDGVNRSGLSWAGDNVMNECLMTHTQDKEQECMR